MRFQLIFLLQLRFLDELEHIYKKGFESWKVRSLGEIFGDLEKEKKSLGDYSNLSSSSSLSKEHYIIISISSRSTQQPDLQLHWHLHKAPIFIHWRCYYKGRKTFSLRLTDILVFYTQNSYFTIVWFVHANLSWLLIEIYNLCD